MSQKIIIHGGIKSTVAIDKDGKIAAGTYAGDMSVFPAQATVKKF